MAIFARTTRTLVFLVLLGACQASPSHSGERKKDREGPFPQARRPIAPIVSSSWSSEADRDRASEATQVMNLAGVRRGMTVADIGAGEGYYTVRLAARVGPKGRVLAQDVVSQVRDKLAERVNRDRLDNVSVKLGEPADPKLPENSFDRVFMVHMYHEIERPYEFLWRLRPALKPDGQVIVVDAERATNQHGTPPAQLDCELGAVGYQRVKFERMPRNDAYLAAYVARGPRPAPRDIRGCAS